MKLTGNKIVITGATSGIGEALLITLLNLGNEIIAVGRNKSKLDALEKLGEGVIPFQCDISRPDELDELVLFLEQSHADTNLLINNAGVQYNYQFAQESSLLSKIEHEVATNFLAPLRLTALILPLLKVNDNAAIVNVSSGVGIVPKINAPVYSATKAGIRMFSRALRGQLKHVKVFELIPPLVDTQMTKGRGQGKVSPQHIAASFIDAFQRDQQEIKIGKIRLLKIIDRVSPRIAERIINK